MFTFSRSERKLLLHSGLSSFSSYRGLPMVKFLKTYCLGDLIDVLIIISRHILMSLTASLFSISEKKK